MAISKKQTSLDKVQTLYLMQVELWNFLDGSKQGPDAVKSVQKTLKEFKALLKEVDWQDMGGEDVLLSLQTIPTEVNEKLKKATPRKVIAKRSMGKKLPAKKTVHKRK